MKQHPILFSTPMVQAILEGRKTMTRRIVKLKHNARSNEYVKAGDCYDAALDEGEHGTCQDFVTIDEDYSDYAKHRTMVGDILWVREAFGELYDIEDHPELPGNPQERWSLGYVFKADNYSHEPGSGMFTGWKPSIHMPKDACRIFLKIKSIRVERLNDIPMMDTLREGLKEEKVGVRTMYKNYKPDRKEIYDQQLLYGNSLSSFCSLWEAINGEGSWKENPFVWVIEFERIEKPI